MELNTENKLNFREKLINFYNLNKVKIFTLLFVILLILASFYFFEQSKTKKNYFDFRKIRGSWYLFIGKKK